MPCNLFTGISCVAPDWLAGWLARVSKARVN